MKTIAVLILFFSVYSNLFGQFEKYGQYKDLFKQYSAPIVNKSIYEKLEKDDATIYIGCYFNTDTSGRVTTMKFYPLEGIGNEYSMYDSVWQSISNSLSNAAKQWIFKPILWNFSNDDGGKTNINKNPIQRPFTGRPRYFFIVEISGINNSMIDKISFIKNFNVTK